MRRAPSPAPAAPSVSAERWPARLALLALLVLPALSEAQRPEVLSPHYETVVRRYASGDREGAVTEISGWPDSRVRDEIPILNREWQRSSSLGALNPATWRQIPVRAALMLHTDCAQRAHREGRPPRIHEISAWSIARTLKEHPAHREFARRWYQAFAELAQAEYRWGEALDWAERGLEDFPDSAELLLVPASIGEMQAFQASQAAPPPAQEFFAHPDVRSDHSRLLQRREVRGHLEKVRDVLRAAINADPALPEAHLRMGRVAWKLGEAAEASAALQAALARGAAGTTAFLAHLFLGRLDEDAGRLDEAARCYQAALAIDPRCQSARLALGHVRLRLGDATAARLEVDETLKFAGRRPQDAFWLYPWGPSVGVEERLEVLRREASP